MIRETQTQSAFQRISITKGTPPNRNALLIHTVGDRFLSADDDTICKVMVRRDLAGQCVLDSRQDLMDFWFLTEPTAAVAAFAPADETDFLALHELLLGKSISKCISDLGGPSRVKCQELSSRFLRGLQLSSPRVVATFTGISGDSGMNSAAGYLLLNPNSRKRLTESEHSYRLACTSRQVARVVEELTITDYPWCMTTAVGWDNSSLLPPFMPVCRNQDGLFGITLRSCSRDAYFGHLPWVISHSPVEKRYYPADDLWYNASTIRLCDVVQCCILSSRSWSDFLGEEECLRALGLHLMTLGAFGPAEFAEFVHLEVARAHCNVIAHLEGQLQMSQGAPPFWVADVRRFIEVMRTAVQQRAYIIPRDLSAGRSMEETLALTKTLVLKFGELIYWWPEVIRAAKRLRSSGKRLASKV